MMKMMMTWIVICVLLASCGCFGSVTPNVPSAVYVGGFFSPVGPNGKVFLDQAEHLAAFMMAVNDINNKTDGIYDDVLVGTDFLIAVDNADSLASAADNAVTLGSSAFGGQGVSAAVVSLGDLEALMVSQLMNTMNVLAVLSIASSGLFDQWSIYPSVINTRPLVSRQGMVVQNMICLSNVRKIVVFVGTDEDDIQMINQFQDEGLCELDIMAVISIRADLEDMSVEIKQALAFGARYFVNFLTAEQNAGLLEQGYDAGLFHDSTVIYASTSGATNITQYFSAETDVARVMTGFIYFEYIPNYYMGRTKESLSFARRWKEQPSRSGQVVGGTQVCDQTKDDNGNFIYQVYWNKTTVCTGLDFDGYDVSGSDILPQTALSYDSAIFLAMAMDMAIKNGLNYKDPNTIVNLMIYNLTHNATTGPLGIFAGYAKYNYNGKGVRSAGTQYTAYNFNPSRYTSGSDDFMVNIGRFDGDQRVFVPCSPVDYFQCFPPVYSGETDGSYNIPPSDTPPVIIFEIPMAFTSLCYLLSGIVTLMVLAFGLFTFTHRRSKVIKASQPMLLWCILIGGLISALRIFFGALPNSDAVCSAEVWFGHLGFIVMIGSLFVKSYRVHCIVNTRKLVRVTFSALHAFRILLAIVLATVVFLIATQLVGKPIMRAEATVVANQETDVRFCALEFPQFQTALFVMEGFLLAISFRVCWEIRHVPDIVNESKQISTGMLPNSSCAVPYSDDFMCVQYSDVGHSDGERTDPSNRLLPRFESLHSRPCCIFWIWLRGDCDIDTSLCAEDYGSVSLG
jgi:hypothetical protein